MPLIISNKTLCSNPMHCLLQTRTQETESLKTQMSDLQKRYQDGIKVNEGLRAKRAYIGFWADFHFLQDLANLWQTDLF